MKGGSLWIRPWTVVAISLGVVMIAAGLFALAWNSNLIVFTSTLQVSELENDGDGGYVAGVFDGDVRVASISVLFPSIVYGGLTDVSMIVSVWHESDWRLNSLMLVFSSNDFLTIALQVPDGYPWPNVEFHRMKSDMKSVQFYVEDLGIQGTGTVTLNFLVRMPSNQQSLDFNFYTQIIMQKNAPLAFSRHMAEAQTSIEFTRA